MGICILIFSNIFKGNSNSYKDYIINYLKIILGKYVGEYVKVKNDTKAKDLLFIENDYSESYSILFLVLIIVTMSCIIVFPLDTFWDRYNNSVGLINTRNSISAVFISIIYTLYKIIFNKRTYILFYKNNITCKRGSKTKKIEIDNIDKIYYILFDLHSNFPIKKVAYPNKPSNMLVRICDILFYGILMLPCFILICISNVILYRKIIKTGFLITDKNNNCISLLHIKDNKKTMEYLKKRFKIDLELHFFVPVK